MQTAAGPAGLHPEPAPLVQADDDARGGQGDRRRPRRRSNRRTRPTSRPTLADVRHLARSRGARRSPRSRPKYPGAPVATTEPVADYMLQAAGIDNLTPFSVPGRHHERRRPVAAGRQPAGRPVHRAQGARSFVYNQQVTDSLTDVVAQPAHQKPASRSSASTRRCRRPATTTSRGCWPRSRRSQKAVGSRTSSTEAVSRDRTDAAHGADPRRRRGRRVRLVGPRDPRRRPLRRRARASSPG